MIAMHPIVGREDRRISATFFSFLFYLLFSVFFLNFFYFTISFITLQKLSATLRACFVPHACAINWALDDRGETRE